MSTGIKISQVGKSLGSAALKDLMLNTDFSMFKYHLDTSASMTINPGDQTKTVAINHGLGYVPAFIAYVGDSNFIYPMPYRKVTLSGTDENFYAYATATQIVIGWKSASPYNQDRYIADRLYWELFLDEDNLGTVVGNIGSGGKNTAYRFPSVSLNRNQSISSASLEIQHVTSGTGTSDTKYRLWGIAEDNVGDVDLGKPKTTAFLTGSQSRITSWFNLGMNATNIVREIIGRSGWNSGNNMGFILNDDASPSNCQIIGQRLGDTVPVLTVTKTGTKTVNFRIIVFKDKIV